MNHWLLKSEPATYSWDQMVKDQQTHWNGVRDHQAAFNLKAMRVGDHAFYYHSGEERAIVGLVEIVKEAYPDPSDPEHRFVMVDVRAIGPTPRTVTLAAIKQEPKLADFKLVRQSRLSVVPVTAAEWNIVSKMAGIAG
jgi:predicted RNA-binding protein with PUA-like domain